MNDIKSIKHGNMEIAYSTKVQKELAKQIKVGNWLLMTLVLAFLILSLMAFLIYTKTGVLGHYMSRMVC